MVVSKVNCEFDFFELEETREESLMRNGKK